MELTAFRKDKDKYFHTSTDSPLTAEQKATFTGLKYYSFNPNLVFELPIDKKIDGEQILPIQTSAGDTEPYRRYGKVNFTVAGQQVTLTVFQQSEGSEFFLPFRDATNGEETYGAGRYVDVEEAGGKLKLDFNHAYNPYCAYNERWRCPLTPTENKLDVPIEAGEKKFQE